MHLGQQLANLKLDQSFIKELNEDDIQFAQKEFKKIYAQQMSKISSKIERIERVKRHLIDIQQQHINKQQQIRLNLDKRIEKKQKKKEKILGQKIKSYKMNHEMWQNKLQNIKRKNKEELKQNFEQLKKFKDGVEKFWNTKTQEITNLAKKRKQYQARCLSLNRKETIDKKSKVKTESNDQVIPEFKRQNTNNSLKNGQLLSKARHHQIKTIRFMTENNNDLNQQNKLHRRNDSHFSHKRSISSMRDHRDSKHSLTTPQVDQNKYSQKLHKNQTPQNHKLKSYFPNLHQEKSFSRNQIQKDEKENNSFQKAMKKLDKIQRIKQKNKKKLKQNEIVLSPCQPRKAIDADQYRLLRAKSQAKKENKKLYSEQNIQSEYRITNNKNSGNFIMRNQSLGKQSRYRTVKSINQSRLSISETIKKQLQIQAKQRENNEQINHNKWKKDKILKAIRDKIFKIKLQEMQKLNKSRVLD